MAGKPAGKLFNVKLEGETKPDGKKQWTSFGRLFVRDDASGGAAWLGPKESETEYRLEPREMKKKDAEGHMFELIEASAEGATELVAPYGRLYIRADKSGGALWVGYGAEEVQYAVFPREMNRGTVRRDQPSASREA